MRQMWTAQVWYGLCVLVGLLLCSGVPAPAQQLSADLVKAKAGAGPVPAGRLLVHGDRVRIETSEFADGFFLINTTRLTAYFVRPATHLYMEARQSSRLTRWFVPVDPDDPCRQWQVMARLAGTANPDVLHCERLGEDIFDGRCLIGYRVTADAREQFSGWVDPIYKFPLRIKTGDGDVLAVENIRDAPPSLSLLEVPPDFRKFDLEALIRRVKQSDVWVAPPE